MLMEFQLRHVKFLDFLVIARLNEYLDLLAKNVHAVNLTLHSIEHDHGISHVRKSPV